MRFQGFRGFNQDDLHPFTPISESKDGKVPAQHYGFR